MTMSKKILVFNINWLGDAVFSLPVFRALKEHFPDSTITCAGPPRIRDIMEGSAFLDAFIPFDERKEDRGLLRKIRFIRILNRHRFDSVYLLHGSLTRALITALAGIPRRVGYATKGRGFLLTQRIELPADGWHRADYYLKVVEDSGVRVMTRAYSLDAGEQAMVSVRRLLQTKGIDNEERLIVINTGGNWHLKRWPSANFSELIDRLVEEFKVKIVIPGGEKDREHVERIAGACRSKPVNCCGETDLKQLTALMRRASCVVSADTGPLHLASGAGTPVVALFGPTHPAVTGPRGTGPARIIQKQVGCNFSPCYNLGCPDNVCMKMIGVDDVCQAVRDIISQ